MTEVRTHTPQHITGFNGAHGSVGLIDDNQTGRTLFGHHHEPPVFDVNQGAGEDRYDRRDHPDEP